MALHGTQLCRPWGAETCQRQPDRASPAAAAAAFLRGVETGKYQPLLDQIFPLSQIAEAHRYLDSCDCVGKTVVLPGVVGAKG